MRVATRSRKARSWVTTIAAGCFRRALSSCVMPSMSRWLVGSSSSSRSGSRAKARARAARLTWPPDAVSGASVVVERKAVQELTESGLRAPAVALVLDGGNVTAQQEALPHRRRVRQRRLLLDERQPQAVAQPEIAAVQGHRAGDDSEQRRFAGAIAPDQPDALVRVHREGGAIEERQVAMGELRVGKGQDRHPVIPRLALSRTRSCSCRP